MLSVFLKPLAQFEKNIRTQIENTTGMPLPLGAIEIAQSTAESIEAAIQSNFGALPGAPLLPLPTGTAEITTSEVPAEPVLKPIPLEEEEGRAATSETKSTEKSTVPRHCRTSFII